MELHYFISIILLILLAEVSYLVVASRGKTALRGAKNAVLLDTSVLIDGRIVSIAKLGFMRGTLVVPRSVVGELQFLADAADHDKRARARFGLDVVAELQSLPNVTVEILQDGSKADEGVDERLLKLAKQYGAAICTLDYNLNKVALVEDITILNVNELAQSLRMAHLPGERIQVELVQKGQDQHQAVGYLPDGTMVVVEHAIRQIGQTVDVEIIRSLQTAAGRMMFAKQLTYDNKQHTVKKQPSVHKPIKQLPQSRAHKNEGRAPVRKKRPMRQQDVESSLINLVKSSEQ